MIQTLIFITGLFGFLAVLCGFLFAASFTRGQRERFPVLRKLDGKQVYFAIGVVLFLVLFYGASTWKSILTTQPLFETVLGPAGEPIEKATLSGFEQELEQGATELKQQAEDFFNAAERDFEKWRYADAADNYQKSSGLIPTMSAYLNLGLSLWYVSDFARAQEAFSSGLRIALKKQDRKLEATFRGNIGIVYRNQGRLEEALRSHQTALHISEEIDNLLGQANTRNNIGIVYRNQGKLEEALKSHRDALAIYNEIGNPRSQATALTGIGIVYRLYRNQGKLEEALKFHRDALAIYNEIGNPRSQATALGNIGLVYFDQGKFEEALKFHRDALAIHKEIGNPLGRAGVLNNIGIVYAGQGKFEEALRPYQDALAIFEEIGHPGGQAQTLNNIGNVYLRQGRLEKALKFHRDALAIHKEIGNPRGQAQDLTSIGVVYYYQGRLEAAVRQSKSVLEIDSTHATAYYNLGCLYSLLDSTDKAIDYISRGRKYFSERTIKHSRTDSDFDNIRDDPRFKKILYGENMTLKN